MDLLNKQLEIEKEATNEGVLRGIELTLNAFKQNRASDTGIGRRIVSRAYEETLPLVQELLNSKARGYGGKYRALMRRVRPEILTVITWRVIIQGCANPDVVLMQDILRNIGRAVETEAIVDVLTDINPYYVDKMQTQIQSEASTSVHHIQRKFRTGAKDLGIEIDPWSSDEKIGVGNLLVRCAYETGLFHWVDRNSGKGQPYKELQPSEELAKHLVEAVEASTAVIRFPPMLVKPRPWENFFQGGYLSDELSVYAPMMTLRNMPHKYRRWILSELTPARCAEAISAANKAQSVPYRVNKEVLAVVRQAMTNPRGILGLPAHNGTPQPDFPLPDEWKKAEATTEELELFAQWKRGMKDWYTAEHRRNGTKVGLATKLVNLAKYQDYSELYFPTFFDWRGRLYFRSTIHPQSHDAIKGCLEFAEGKRLGAEGLYWLKVHVANCCGYDKMTFDKRVEWVDENLVYIRDFVNDPLFAECPEPSTAFTLLQAGLALVEALDMDNPEDYVCHVPVAMDATCSGLQHFSAMFKDHIGGKFTNLYYEGADQKADIYRHVAKIAEPMIKEMTDDPVLLHYWKDKEIPRSMAKRPVMTYVYGSTLQSTLEYVADDLRDSGEERFAEYSWHAIAVPVGKALRKAVELTVPAAAEGMKYLQQLVRVSDKPMRWYSPVGIPVVNWTEKHDVQQLKILSMGVQAVKIRKGKGEYDKQSSVSSISPNFVHSLDSAHLCKTINSFGGSIVPIHDSFGTHPSDVGLMHKVLRETFVEMYQGDVDQLLVELLETSKELPPRPTNGSLDINKIKGATFMFC